MSRIVPAAAWRRLQWRTVPRIGPTGEFYVHHGAAGAPTLATLRAYEAWHVRNNGWSALGYNFAITGDGTIYEGRGWLAQGAHTSGRNTVSHAVVLVGDFSSARVSDAAVEALAWLTVEGHRVGALRTPTITGGHREAPGQSTSCPGNGGMDAVARARRLLTGPPRPLPPVIATPEPKENDVMTPAQEAKLDEALKLLRQRNYADDSRRIRLSIRAIGRHLGIRTSVNGKDDGSEVIT
jgi:hypothetical protein